MSFTMRRCIWMLNIRAGVHLVVKLNKHITRLSAFCWHLASSVFLIFFIALHYSDQFLLTEEGSLRLGHIVQEKE